MYDKFPSGFEEYTQLSKLALHTPGKHDIPNSFCNIHLTLVTDRLMINDKTAFALKVRDPLMFLSHGVKFHQDYSAY